MIVQLRVGGNQARYLDETIPLDFGASVRRRPALGVREGVAHGAGRARARAAHGGTRRAGAWFVDFTNPTGLVSQALLDEGHRAIGLCNVAIGFQRDFAEIFDMTPVTCGSTTWA